MFRRFLRRQVSRLSQPQKQPDVRLSCDMSDAAVVVVAALTFVVFVSLLIWVAWRAFTPRGIALYFAMWTCGVFTAFCAFHSTWPSSAPRQQANGIITWIVEHKEGKS